MALELYVKVGLQRHIAVLRVFLVFLSRGSKLTSSRKHLAFQGSNFPGKALVRSGHCPFSHSTWMICALKRLDQLQVKFVDMDKLSMDKTGFTKITSRKAVPVLRHGDDIIDDPMEIGEYLEKIFPDPPLASKNQRAVAAGVNNAFAKFSALIRNREPSKDNILRDHLIEELRKLDGFLRSDESPGVFLDGDELKLPDCYLLPKLYQIKVAAGELKGFTIPEEFAAVKRYLKTAEKTPEFKHTAPLEEEIVLGWKRKMT